MNIIHPEDLQPGMLVTVYKYKMVISQLVMHGENESGPTIFTDNYFRDFMGLPLEVKIVALPYVVTHIRGQPKHRAILDVRILEIAEIPIRYADALCSQEKSPEVTDLEERVEVLQQFKNSVESLLSDLTAVLRQFVAIEPGESVVPALKRQLQAQKEKIDALERAQAATSQQTGPTN